MTAVVPGAGKSYACEKFLEKNNLKGLFVINNNNLGIKIKTFFDWEINSIWLFNYIFLIKNIKVMIKFYFVFRSLFYR